VAGTQLGLALIVAVVGIGLTSVIEVMGHWLCCGSSERPVAVAYEIGMQAVDTT
jgi:hypothetical protein